MDPLLSVGEINLYLSDLTAVLGIVIAGYFFAKKLATNSETRKKILLAAVFALIGGIIIARLAYVLTYDAGYYFSNPLEIFLIQTNELLIHGGLLGGLLLWGLLLRIKKAAVWETLDIAAPFLALAQGVAIIGGSVIGVPTSNDPLWAININGILVHPVQAYEFTLLYFLFGYLWLRVKSSAYTGQVIFHFLIGKFAINTVVDFFKEGSPIWGSLSLNQILSIAAVVLLVILMFIYKKTAKQVAPKTIERYEIAKTWFYIWLLTTVSLLFYYVLQV